MKYQIEIKDKKTQENILQKYNFQLWRNNYVCYSSTKYC